MGVSIDTNSNDGFEGRGIILADRGMHTAFIYFEDANIILFHGHWSATKPILSNDTQRIASTPQYGNDR